MAKKRLTVKQKRQLELAIIFSVALLSLLLWNTVLIYPVKLFVVLIHEISHGIFTILTGGKVVSIELDSYLGGGCISKGGIPWVIASTGYLGSIAVGALLFISAYKHNFSLWFCSILAVILIVFIVNSLTGTLAIIFSIIIAVILLVSPRFFPRVVHSYMMKILGLVSCMYVIIDIKDDLLSSSYGGTDAQLLTYHTGVPAYMWGWIWFIISIAVLFFLIRYGHKKGLTKK